MEFFNSLHQKLQLKNIALHSEFRLSDDLIPIEINSMRFGGMGLGNMIYHSLKVNPYQYFLDEKSPTTLRKRSILLRMYPLNFDYSVSG